MAGKQRTISSPTSVFNQCYQCNSHIALKNTGSTFTSSTNFYLPVDLPVSPSLPPDVALWLVELRHRSESSDLLAGPRPRVDDESLWSSDEDEQSHFELNSDSGRDTGTTTIEPSTIAYCEDSCTSLHHSDDTVLNLDLHRKKTTKYTSENENEDLFQIWEGLKIPRQSLCATSLRVPNLNASCEVLSRDSQADTISYIETKRDRSYWEVNPMYSKGGLVDTKDSPGRDKVVVAFTPSGERPVPAKRWVEPKSTSSSETPGEVGKFNSSSGRQSPSPQQGSTSSQARDNTKCNSSDQCYAVDRPDLNRNWKLTNIREESVEDVGYILSHENNYGISIDSLDKKDCLSSRALASEVSMECRSSSSISTSHSGSRSGSEGTKPEPQGHLNSPLGKKCVDILNNLDDMILTFQEIHAKTQAKDPNSDSPTISIKDNDFEHMCERADLIIEETMKCHLDSEKNSTRKVKKPLPESLRRTGQMERTSSDMSDEVFLNPITEKENSFSPVFMNETENIRSETQNVLNVNKIFDDDSKTTHPVPPLRKRRLQDSPKVTGNNANNALSDSAEKYSTDTKDDTMYEYSNTFENHSTKFEGERSKPPIKPREKVLENVASCQQTNRSVGSDKPAVENNSDKNNRYENQGTDNVNQRKVHISKCEENASRGQVHGLVGSTELTPVSLEDFKLLSSKASALPRKHGSLGKAIIENERTTPLPTSSDRTQRSVTRVELVDPSISQLSKVVPNVEDRTKPLLTYSENMCASLKTISMKDTENKTNSLERQRKDPGKNIQVEDRTKPMLQHLENVDPDLKNVNLHESRTQPLNASSLERHKGPGKNIPVEDRTKPESTHSENVSSGLKNVNLQDTKAQPLNASSLERKRENPGKNIPAEVRTKPVLTPSETTSSSLKNTNLQDMKTQPLKVNSLERKQENPGKKLVEVDHKKFESNPPDFVRRPVDPRFQPMSSRHSLERSVQLSRDKQESKAAEESPSKSGPKCDQTASSCKTEGKEGREVPYSSGSTSTQFGPVCLKKDGRGSLNPSDLSDNNQADDTSSSVDSNSSFDYKIQLTQTKPISSTTFPPSNASQHPSVPQQNSSLPKSNLSSFKNQNVALHKSHSDASQNVSRKSNSTIFTGRPLSFHNFPKSSNSESVLNPDSNAYLLKYASVRDENVAFQNASPSSSPCVTPMSRRSQGSDISRPRSARKSFDTASLDESLERTRKGSNASDIAAWKQRMHLTNSYFHDEEMDPNSMMSNEWFSSNVGESNAYLRQENRNESQTALPAIQVMGCSSDQDRLEDSPESSSTGVDPRAEKLSFANIASLIEAELRGKQQGPFRVKKAKSMVLNFPKTSLDEKDDTVSKSTKWPEVWDENIKVVKEGILHRTKITENGRKVRKNWVTSFAVLTDQYLLFFKDVKTFNAMKISTDKFQPELSLDLSCGTIEQDDKLSSRKNVLCVGDGHGSQVLVQLSTPTLSEQWFHLINTTIALQLASDSCLRLPARDCSPPTPLEASVLEEILKSPRIDRTRSIKATTKELESNEDLSASAEERQSKNRARLKKFFGRRPTKESLVKKGIYKDEPMFGRNLCDVVSDCIPCVPSFVTLCIKAIESKEENMKTDGLYRASGNLSQVQKIRLQVDQNQLCALEEEEDVHVLTGALKLFFRELKKPLIPSEYLSKAITASAQRDSKERVRQFRSLVQSLPTPNHNTLDFLLQHLLKVNENKECNRMHIPNIAIVFGPTLMWPEQESLNMALDLMKQNQVIECLLVEYHEIFC